MFSGQCNHAMRSLIVFEESNLGFRAFCENCQVMKYYRYTQSENLKLVEAHKPIGINLQRVLLSAKEIKEKEIKEKLKGNTK